VTFGAHRYVCDATCAKDHAISADRIGRQLGGQRFSVVAQLV
jgi:hypothetical protein